MQDTPGVIQHLVGANFDWLFRESLYWTVFGLVGNLMFGLRFFVQWLHSEKHQKLIVPPVFWYLSFYGSIVCLIYAIHIDKMPIILGYCFLPVIYARNLRLLKKTKTEMPARQDS